MHQRFPVFKQGSGNEARAGERRSITIGMQALANTKRPNQLRHSRGIDVPLLSLAFKANGGFDRERFGKQRTWHGQTLVCPAEQA